MTTRIKRYYFNPIDKCNMCGSTMEYHKVLGKRLNSSQGKYPKNKIGITTTIMKCRNCDLVFSNPQPVPFDIQDHYGVPPENYWKEEYFVIDDNYFKNEISKLKTLIKFERGMKSLDIGAGLGKQMIALKHAGFDAHGFEASRQFYERAIYKMGIDTNKLRLGQIETIEYPENHFDFISFGAVLEHLYNPSDSILKALKWVKSNGIIHIEVPSSKWLTARTVNLFYRLSLTDYVGNLSPMHEPYHLHEFGLKSFINHAKTHNYEVVDTEYYVCETYMPMILNFILIPYMKLTNKGMQLCVWLRKK